MALSDPDPLPTQAELDRWMRALDSIRADIARLERRNRDDAVVLVLQSFAAGAVFASALVWVVR